MKSFYDISKDFGTKSEEQKVYKNIYETNYFSSFVPTETPTSHLVTEADVDRIDILMYRYYNSAEWDDIIMFINKKSSIYEIKAGDTLLLPSLTDLISFYNEGLE